MGFERAYFTKLDALSDFIPKLQKAIEDAKTALLKIKDEAMAKAATIVAKSVAEVLKKAIQPVKEALMKAADAAVELAKQGLTGLTGVLGQIPTKVQGALTEACGALPGGDELKGVCTAGLADVIKKATEVLGKVCTAGTTALIGEATKACTTASTKADELLKSADDACSTAATSLPETISKPIAEACTNVTTELKGVVGEICTSTKDKAEAALKSACDALAPKAAEYARIHGYIRTMELLQQYHIVAQAAVNRRRISVAKKIAYHPV